MLSARWPVHLEDYAPSVWITKTKRDLRKLAPSVDFYGSLIGVWQDGKNRLSIWGIVHSGPQWAQSLHGGGKGFQPLPDSLMLSVTEQGRITISNGSTEIAALNAGKIVGPSTAVFDSMWVRSEFVSTVDEELTFHREARKSAKKPWTTIDPDFLGTIKKQAFMRIIGRICSHRHGGPLIFILDEFKKRFLSENPSELVSQVASENVGSVICECPGNRPAAKVGLIAIDVIPVAVFCLDIAGVDVKDEWTYFGTGSDVV